ncbi:MAG: glycosyltransferase family 4 protein [Planctomycetota bacterium]
MLTPNSQWRPQTVLLCHNYYQHRGGEDQIFEDEAALLESQGHTVIRYSKSNDDIESIGLLKTACKAIWNRDCAAEVRDLIAEHQPDVLHSINTFPLLSASIFYEAHQAGLPVVATVQNYRAFCAQSMCSRNGNACEACLGKLPWRAIAYGCYRGSRLGSTVVSTMQVVHQKRKTWQRYVDIMCLASEFSKSRYLQSGFTEEQIRIKPNFVLPDPGLGEGQGDCAVFIGRLFREKGIPTLLEAWEKLPNPPQLKIFGDGPMVPEVEAAAKHNPNIVYRGFQDPKLVRKELGNAGCLVFPSTGYESLPKTIIDALAVGTPTLGAAQASVPELVQPGKTGLLWKPGDADSFVQAIQSHYANRENWPAMRAACREDYERRFSAEVNYQMLLGIYREARCKRMEQATSA